jgi:type VI secretion system protein ImpI
MLPLLVRVDDLTSGASRQYAFARSPVRFGRSPMNDVVLDAPFISQWHGLVHFDAETTEYFDLGSTNGTFADGARLAGKAGVPVTGDVELRVHHLRFFCWRGAAPPGIEPDQAAAEALGPVSRTMLGIERRGSLREARDRLAPAPALGAALERLRPAHAAYRQAKTTLLGGIRDGLAGLSPEQHDAWLALVQKEFPELAAEPALRRLDPGQPVPDGATVALPAGPMGVVDEFARALVPGAALKTLADVEKFLVRAATMLETSARAFIELRQGQVQFGKEMAVRTFHERSPLAHAREPSEVLAYLLDIRADATARIQELSTAYADLMIHQVALLGGLMEGVRSLLGRLGPETIDQEIDQAPLKLGPLTLSRRLWPFRARSRWKRFVRRYREYLEEEKQLTAAVFGADFARAYSAVASDDPGRPARAATGTP